jgi:hypothetical protein
VGLVQFNTNRVFSLGFELDQILGGESSLGEFAFYGCQSTQQPAAELVYWQVAGLAHWAFCPGRSLLWAIDPQLFFFADGAAFADQSRGNQDRFDAVNGQRSIDPPPEVGMLNVNSDSERIK